MTIELANSGESEALSDENKAIILLNSLPESFKEGKSAIKYGRTSITLEEVVSALRSKELELKTEKSSSSNGESYYARGRSSQRGPNYNNHGRSNSKNKGRSSSRGPNSGRKCYHCGKIGHIKKDCYSWQRKLKEKGNSSNSNTSDNHETINYSDGYDSGEVLIVTVRNKSNSCILDSGCSYHMTCNKHWLHNYKEIDGGKVVLGNNETCQVKGIGDVTIQMYDGIERTLKDVRYIPELVRNLISLGTLDDLGYTNKMEAGTLKISKGSMVVIRGEKINGIYHLIGETVNGGVSVAENPEDKSARL